MTGSEANQAENGVWDQIGGLWDDFNQWAEKPKNKQMLIGGGSALVANVLRNKGLLGSDAPKVGFQGKIPEYTATRTPIQYEQDPNRRPGSGGRRYFSDVTYTPKAQGIAGQTQPSDPIPSTEPPLATQPGEPSPGGIATQTDPDSQLPIQAYAEGGLASAAKGQYLKGETDGMADKVPATIDGDEPAALSDGEYVIPADVVSHLGNGNSEAGAKVLDQMLARIRKERTGNDEQGKEIDPNKFIPR